jgi:exonuclease III
MLRLFSFCSSLLFGLHLQFCVADTYCPTAPSNPEDRRTNQSTLRIVQLNTEWLFVDGYDDCPGSNCPWKDDEMAQSHVSAIANVIAELNPDLINLAEVESCDELHDLLNDPSLAGYGYAPYMVQGTDTATGQDVGILTKIDPLESLYRTEMRVNYPLSTTTCNSSYSGSQGVSKHYITSIAANGLKIAIIGIHFLAYPDDEDRCVQREAQATVIQSIIEPYLTNGYEVMILGDMNDWDKEVIDANNNLPISQVLDILKGNTAVVNAAVTGNGTEIIIRSHAGGSWELQNVASKLIQSERYSCWYDSNRDCIYKPTETSMIDHILVSKGLFDHISGVSIAHSAYEQECASDFYYSDHWPVVVEFQF